MLCVCVLYVIFSGMDKKDTCGNCLFEVSLEKSSIFKLYAIESSILNLVNIFFRVAFSLFLSLSRLSFLIRRW